MEHLREAFTVEHVLRLLVVAVAVGLLVRLAQFGLRRAGAPVSKNESLVLCGGVLFFLFLTDTIHGEILTAITYATVLVAGFSATKIATRFLK